MTPHVLLVTLDPKGEPMLLPLHAITSVEPDGEGARIYDRFGDLYRVQQPFDAIVAVLGGLVMKPGPR